MARYRSKHRIYTVVIGKRKPYVAAAVMAAVAVAIVGSCFLPVQKGGAYESFLKRCIAYTFMTDSARDYSAIKKTPLTAYSLLSHISPVFLNENPPALKGKKEISPSPRLTAAAQEKSQKVISKSIISNNLDIKNETDYQIDAPKLSAENRTYTATGNEPKVLIIHTHACETYSNENGTGLGDGGEYRTTDTSKNMVKIGEIMAAVFKEEGIIVIHDKTLCDYPNYNSSYVKSLEVIESYLAKYPTVEFVFDIHRDAIAADDGTPTKLTCKINGENSAQAMIVCGTDAMGLENPNWRENLILALKIQKNLEEKYPGFMRPVNLRRERFNMHKTTGSLLFEIGTHGNTPEEAERAAEILAEGIAETIEQS